MRLPVNFVLYVVSAGLLGLAGYSFYDCLKSSGTEVHKRAYEVGIKEADDLLARGRGQGPVASTWNYDSKLWGDYFRAPNLIGREPRNDAPTDPVIDPKSAPQADQRPLDDIIELVSLVSDTSTGGKGGKSHVIVRYRPNVEVQQPRWYQLENQPIGPSMPMSAAADTVPGRGRPTRPTAGRPAPPTPATALPMSTAGQEILQVLWVAGDGSPKFEATLWPPFQDIRLICVEPDALSARFRRPGLPAADGTQGPAIEEDVIRSAMDLSPDLKKTLVDLHRGSAARVGLTTPKVAITTSGWQDFEETRIIGSTVHISRRDQAVMQANPETLIDRINVDSYVSRNGSGTRGLLIVNVAPDIAQRFGVVQNDLILSINDQPVSTKADAIAIGKRLYNRGVRTFVVKFLSNGQPVERTYQAPDR